MGDQPRKHHFVPEFYLAGFTIADTRDAVLYVLDKDQLRQWPSTPRQTAHKRDFHAIDPRNGSDPMVVEKALSQLEGKWASTLRSVVQNQKLPADDSFGDLMVFVAFMAVRVLRIRDILSGFIDRVSKSMFQLRLATDEGRAGLRRTLEDLGRKLSDQEFDELVQFARSGEYEVNFEQTWHVQEMVRMAIVLAPLLSLRKWCIWVVEDGAPDLICSDSPVAPTWAVPMPGPFPPAFGTLNTVVSVPLNRRIALVSMIEEQLPELRLDQTGVAVVNSMTAMYANQLYSSTPDFVWRTKDHENGNAADLLKALQSHRTAG